MSVLDAEISQWSFTWHLYNTGRVSLNEQHSVDLLSWHVQDLSL